MPMSLTFDGTNQTQMLHVTDPSYTGSYTIGGCASTIVTTGTVTNGLLAVTSQGVGTCTLSIADSFSHTSTVAVTVSTLSVPIQ